MELPISAEMLAKRWGLKPIDLFFIMWNHDLNVLTQNGNLVGVDDALDAIPQEYRDKRLAIEDWYFSLAEVDKLEKSPVGDLLSKKHEIVRGQHLIDKWDLDDFALYTIVSQTGWDFVDPFGKMVGCGFFLAMCAHGNFNISEAWFRTSDVDKFEKEEFGKYQKASEIKVAIDNDGTNATSFYKKGQKWMIGKYTKEMILDDKKGFEIIRYLIKNEGEKLDVIAVGNIGKIAIDDCGIVSGHVPAGLNLSPAQILSHPEQDMDGKFLKTSYQIDGEFSPEHLIDGQTESTVTDVLRRAKEKLKTETDESKIIEANDNIAKMEKYLRDGRKSSKTPRSFRSNGKEKMRQNVQKRIKAALETIEREVHEITEYLNNDTISTGSKCSYKPDRDKTVKWILDPP